MTNPNPFVFQGLPNGAPGNPLLQSLEMMRQAWGKMAPNTGLPTGFSSAIPLEPSEIDRRIAELQAVENWLTLNLSMLQGTIRALEVQRATIATLRSFANLGSGATGAEASSNEPSPLEVALGLKPAPNKAKPSESQAQTSYFQPDAETATDSPANPATAGLPPIFTDPTQAAAAQQAWWGALQQQFQQIAGAAATSFQSPSVASPSNAEPAPATHSQPASPRKAATKRARKSAGSTE